MLFSSFLKKFLQKGSQDLQNDPLNEEQAKFELLLDEIRIGILTAKVDGFWQFQYTNEFKKLSDEYYHIVGFSNLEKTYQSETLWPFFQIRIPGLNQPKVRETLEREKIDAQNKVALLKRFGQNSISNPYQLRLT